MKKHLRMLAMVLAVSLLSGCGQSLMYDDYREIDQLELIQVLGVDTAGKLATVTAATNSLSEPLVLKNSSVTVNRAMREMQEYTSKKYIFYGHTKHLLIGEDAARKNLSFYMEYMERGVEMRLDTRLYIIQGGTAEQAISATTGGEYNVGALLDSLEKDVQLMSESHVFSCGEVAEALAESGCGLAAAVVLVEEDNIVSGSKKLTLQSSGYAVLKEERLVAFLDTNLARGVNLLINETVSDVIEVPDGQGGWAALRVTKAGTRFEPVFEDGRLTRVKAAVEITCNLDELQNPVDIYNAEELNVLERGVEAMEKQRVEQALSRSQELGADLCRVGKRVRMKAPIRFERMPEPWETVFPQLAFDVEVKAELVRTYDVGLSHIRSWLTGRG